MSLNQLVGETADPSNTPTRRGLPSWLLPVGLLIGFLFLFAILFGQKLLPAQSVRTAPVVTLRLGDSQPSSMGNEQASRLVQPSQLLFQASGWLEPDPYPVIVPTLVNGVVDEVHVLEGDSVTEGQLLATLVDDDARLALKKAERALETMRARIAAHCSKVPEVHARLDSARSQVLAQKATLDELQDQLDRLRSLPKGASSAQDLTRAALQVERQEAVVAEVQSAIPRLNAELETIDFERVAMGQQFQELEADVEIAQLALDRHRITSPVSGRVLELHAGPGRKRMLDMDDPDSATIVSLYLPTQMQARIDVPLNEAAALGVGQPVELVTDLLPDTTFRGVVTRITGEADIQRNTLQAKVALENPDDRLRPEMLMRAKFYSIALEGEGDEQAPAPNGRLTLLAPTPALFDINGDAAKAWVVGPDNEAEQRNLQLGDIVRDDHRQVLSGLRSGEQLILPPYQNLQTGTRVQPSES
ncbi:MAG: efflux RND transporter periplasmic adaptor subunit [Verrucomicrobiota bacterium JB023]|nr:efflux RND transporter periplasmic adaptor subunit [Verrucomicrobiota bacterium JB023]